jgi:hypothetical protein
MPTDVGEAVRQPADKTGTQGMRKNGMFCLSIVDARSNSLPGKQWHPLKSAFRPKAGNGTYEKRQAGRAAMEVVKSKEKKMKEEKEAERQVSVQWLESISLSEPTMRKLLLIYFTEENNST